MFRHFLKIAFRNFWKYKTFSFLNITGLAIGMASAMILFLWMHNQMTMDQYHEKKNNLYKLHLNTTIEGRIQTSASVPAPLLQYLKKDFPEIKNITRIQEGSKLLRYSEAKINATGNIVDPSFLQMFSFPLVSGSTATSLKESNSLLISEKLAKILFREEDPINKVIHTVNGSDLIVTGIFKDLPENTQFKFDYLIPWDYLQNQSTENTSWDKNVSAFVEVGSNTNIKSLNTNISSLMNRLTTKVEKGSVFLYPLDKLWLESHFQNGKPAGGVIDLVKMLGIIAFIILLIACINFMNLSTARSLKRAKEVGMRKVMGGKRSLLIWQFIGESVFLTFIGGILAFVIAILLLPSFNDITGKHLRIEYASPYFWLSLLLFILVTGFLAGVYPAFFLSSFKPVKALKGVLEKGSILVRPRKVLFVFQFSIAIILINFTILVKRQISHIQERNAGFIKENLVFHPLTEDLKNNYSVIKDELLKSGVVSSVSKSNVPITRSGSQTDELDWAGKDKTDKVDFEVRTSTQDFAKSNGLNIVKGRDIDITTFPADTSTCLINETAMKLIGSKDPIGTIIKEGDVNWTVVGVVNDFITSSPLQSISPVIIKGAKQDNYINIRVNSTNAFAENLKTVIAILKKNNPNYITEILFADDDYRLKTRGLELTASLANIFAAIAIFISCLGLLGLVIYIAETKAKEISIRKVFGANMTSLMFLLSKDFLTLVLISIAIASPISWFLMSSFLRPIYYRTNMSLVILIEAAVIALSITLFTISSQSIRAVLANPIKSLRNE